MSDTKNSLIIQYAGDSFTLSGEDSLDHLKRVGEFANEELEEVKAAFGVNQPTKDRLLALSAINTAEAAVKLAEYSHILKDRVAGLEKEIELLKQRILELEDEVLTLESSLQSEDNSN